MGKAKAPRRLEVKFRVRPLVRMPKSVAFQKLKQFVDSGIAPHDLEVAYMEYAHSRGRKFTPGQRIQPDDWEELRKFYAAMTAIKSEDVHASPKRGKYTRNPSVRFERPD